MDLPRAARNGAPLVATEQEDTTRSLGREVVELARTLPGDLRRLTVRNGACEVEVEWAGAVAAPAATATAAPAAAAPAAEEPEAAEAAPGTVTVRAPLVGTFYESPSPGADPFVRVGDEVEAGQTLGIVEAMKLMNPIVCDAPGVVAEVCVGNGESVEYDQPLVRLTPPGRLA
ncbi:acetyl-CoA carboxylase biotin carboxyl carrier protein [Geodermatophilus marinus]|nr:acetyl-CoA carboxylase biotin carboxyl carrier protein [Geodermatophilus sp. LHW52908]